MKRRILLSVFMILLLVGCHHSDSTDSIAVQDSSEQSSPTHEEAVPASQLGLVTDAVYEVSADNSKAFVVLSDISRNELNGTCYMVKSHECVADPVPLHIRIYRKSCEVEAGNRSYEVQVRKRQLNSLFDGHRHNVKFDQSRQTTFSVKRYSPPEFRDTVDLKYNHEVYDVKVVRDLTYARANGYWSSKTGNENESYGKIAVSGIKESLRQKEIPLMLDLYVPLDGGNLQHPLVLFIHGGAFYVGDKSDEAIALWCRHFARMGYVAASMNYRMGFKPSHNEIHREIYMATQDAHAAMRYLLSADSSHLINPSQLFVAGTSAGAITALNMAYMTNSDRPKYSYRPRRRFKDLGNLETSGNDYKKVFQFRAVANMWGAVENVNIMQGSNTHIISFHGDEDNIVPYEQGYPFNELGDWLGKRLFGVMYGSAALTRQAELQGLRHRLITLPGADHAPHLDEERKIIPGIHRMIQDSISDFFYHTLVESEPRLVRDESNPGIYQISGDSLQQVMWQAEHGVIVRNSDKEAEIIWLGKVGKVHACGLHECGKWFSL